MHLTRNSLLHRPTAADVANVTAGHIDLLCGDNLVTCHPLKRWLESRHQNKLSEVAVSLFRVPASPTAEKRMFQVC
jgi:hypothetical protein